MLELQGQGDCSLSPPHHPQVPPLRSQEEGSTSPEGSGANEVRAQLGILHVTAPGWAAGTQATSGSRCLCVITSAPLAFLDFAACLLHLQQYPESSMPFEFL